MFINLAVDIILSDKFEDVNSSENNININNIINYNLSVSSIDLYAHLLEAYNSDLIRSENINSLIDSFVKRKFKNYQSNNFNIDNDILFSDLLIEGRKKLLNFIDKKNIANINSDLILFLDSQYVKLSYSKEYILLGT